MGNCPSGELSWWGIVLVEVILVGNCPIVGNCPGIVLVGNCPSGELS